MIDFRHPPPRLLFAVAAAALGACTGIRHYTYEIELTTDTDLHTVQLWYDEGRGAGEQPAFSLTLPQSYYAYRDNHDAEKQTTIGLLLDRQTLRPLTEVIASEMGTVEPLRVPGWKEGPLKKLAWGKFLQRQLFVTIRGRTAPPALKPHDPAKAYVETYEWVGKQAGFMIYRLKHAPTYNGDEGDIVGFASDTPDLTFDCMGVPKNFPRAGTIPRCNVEQPYHDATVSISVTRGDLPNGPALMLAVRKLLDRHVG